MRYIFTVAAALILTSAFVVPVSAQTRPAAAPARPAAAQPAPGPVPDTKIAYVNTEAFSDEKAGITRFVSALKGLEREFQPRQTELTTIQTRIKTLASEIETQSRSSVVDPKSIQAKQEEGERLERDLKRKKEDADAAFAKRYDEVISPLSRDIGNALTEFANQRGITMVLDITKLAPAILTANRNMDITQAFIADYNSKPATAAAGTTPR